jgi:long-chain acyl-CoA synthetase
MVVAVIVPSEDAVNKYGGKEAAVKSIDLELAILEDLEKVCRAEKLKGYEIPKAVLFHPDEWTPESGFVTPSFKLKRSVLLKHFAAEIEGLYATLNEKAQE